MISLEEISSNLLLLRAHTAAFAVAFLSGNAVVQGFGFFIRIVYLDIVIHSITQQM